MDVFLGQALTRSAVWLAIACYLGRVFVDLRLRQCRPASTADRHARRLWTVGCGFYLLHVLCAFAFFHSWSHAHAYRHTVIQTKAVTGLEWGGGLYINYAFTALWIADTTAWWLGGLGFPYRSRTYFWTVHAIFAFMVFNATVVFGPPIWRLVALACAVVLAASYLRCDE